MIIGQWSYCIKSNVCVLAWA